MVVFGQKLLFSDKSSSLLANLVVFGYSGCIRTKVVLF